MSAPLRGHQHIDQRSLALHRAIAGKLRRNPELIAVALDNLERWSRSAGRSQPYCEDESEHMTAMRQATPFAGVLDPAERWAIYAEFAP